MGKTEYVGLRIEPELLGKIDLLAEKENRSRSNMIEVLLTQALEALEARELRNPPGSPES